MPEFATSASALLDDLERGVLARVLGVDLVPQDPADECASALLARPGQGDDKPTRRGRAP